MHKNFMYNTIKTSKLDPKNILMSSFKVDQIEDD